MYNGYAQAVELLRSSKDGTHSVSPSCATLTQGYPHLTPSELYSAQKPLFTFGEIASLSSKEYP